MTSFYRDSISDFFDELVIDRKALLAILDIFCLFDSMQLLIFEFFAQEKSLLRLLRPTRVDFSSGLSASTPTLCRNFDMRRQRLKRRRPSVASTSRRVEVAVDCFRSGIIFNIIITVTMDSIKFKIFVGLVCLVASAAAEPKPDEKNVIGEFGENPYGIKGKVYKEDDSTMLVENFYYKGW